jgi:hypothetical protein
MKRTLLIIVLFTLTSYPKAQQYHVSTEQRDSFSIALVKLLNAVTNRFEDYKGDSLTYNWLTGFDYRLNLDFPGSSMAVVRARDWDRNAYVEFRGYKDEKSVRNNFQLLIEKIKKAMGDQLLMPEWKINADSYVQMIGFSLKGKTGYFNSNFEMFTGQSTLDPYLGSSAKEGSGPQKYFILLKINGRTPSYKYYISPNVSPPDEKLHKTLKQLLESAAEDFVSLHGKKPRTLKRKKIDSLSINGHIVVMNYRGAHHTATISFPAPLDSIAFNKQWEWCHRSIQAAVGSAYVYLPFKLTESRYIAYHAKSYKCNNPDVQLEH